MSQDLTLSPTEPTAAAPRKSPRLGLLIVLSVCVPFWGILAWLAWA